MIWIVLLIVEALMVVANIPGALAGNPLSFMALVFCSFMFMIVLVLASRRW